MLSVATTALLLSRQNLPYAPRQDADLITRGAYVLAEPGEVGVWPQLAFGQSPPEPFSWPSGERA